MYGMAGNEALENCALYGSILAGNVIEVFGPKMDADRWRLISDKIKEIGEHNR